MRLLNFTLVILAWWQIGWVIRGRRLLIHTAWVCNLRLHLLLQTMELWLVADHVKSVGHSRCYMLTLVSQRLWVNRISYVRVRRLSCGHAPVLGIKLVVPLGILVLLIDIIQASLETTAIMRGHTASAIGPLWAQSNWLKARLIYYGLGYLWVLLTRRAVWYRDLLPQESWVVQGVIGLWISGVSSHLLNQISKVVIPLSLMFSCPISRECMLRLLSSLRT